MGQFPTQFSQASRNLDQALVSTRRKALQNMKRSSFNGTAITPVPLNNVLEIELPYYTIGQRFRPGRFLDMSGTGDTQAVEIACETSQWEGDQNFRIDHFTSVGEDFTLGMFVGAPIIYSYTNPAAA